MRTFAATTFLLLGYFQCIGQLNQPKKLLIYYGFPSKINNVTSTQAAADTFSKYQYVVWPDNMENAIINPTETPKNQQIFGKINPATKVFGYISLSMNSNGPKLSQSAIRQKIDMLDNFGVHGILFDECGYADNVKRARLDSSVRYAHSKGLSIIANTLYPQEIYTNQYHAVWNPTSMPTPFNNTDFYLFESHVIMNGNYFRFPGENGSIYDEWEFWYAKSDTIRRYESLIGFKTFSVTTPDYYSNYDKNKHYFAWYCAWLNGHEASGWSEQNYSSDAPGNTSQNLAPYRTPPAISNTGNRFLSTLIKQSNNYIRYTNRGKIRVNTQLKTYNFGDFDTIYSQQSGSWNTPGTWEGGVIPQKYNHVVIRNYHHVFVPANFTAECVKFLTNDYSVFWTHETGRLRINSAND